MSAHVGGQHRVHWHQTFDGNGQVDQDTNRGLDYPRVLHVDQQRNDVIAHVLTEADGAAETAQGLVLDLEFVVDLVEDLWGERGEIRRMSLWGNREEEQGVLTETIFGRNIVVALHTSQGGEGAVDLGIR